VAGETLSFDIFARLREDGFSKAGRAALAASDDVLELQKRLEKVGATSVKARVDLKGNDEALAQLDKLNVKLTSVGGRVANPKISVEGALKAQAELAALAVSLDSLSKKSEDATGSIGSKLGGLASPSGMGALIAAGVALSPVLTTVAFGVGGFGLAAAGAVAPIVKAAGATGGLRANMATLGPEQQILAKSILGLGKQYDAFSKSLQPEVLSVFGKGIQIAGNLMHDVQPIAAATGKALDSMLGAVDKEFQSGTWQKFFAFMAKTAGPDIKLISDNFIGLLDVLPGVLTQLQPLATALLKVTDAGFKVIGFLDKTHILLPVLGASIGLFLGGPVGALIGGFIGLGSEAIAANDHLAKMPPQFTRIGGGIHALTPQFARFGASAEGAATASDAMAGGLQATGQQATAVKQPVFNLATAVDTLTASMDKNIGSVLTLQGDEDAWRLSLLAADKQLASNSAGLRGNSKDALDNKEAVRQTTVSVLTFADDQLKLGGNLHAASGRIADQIAWLQKHGDKSKFARDEIHALRVEEDKLKDQIKQRLLVSATGFWKVTGALQGGVPQAGGGPRNGREGVDDQLIVAQRGELVVPTAIVKAGLTDHLRGLIPGFATGGVIGQYSGSVGGAPKWLAREDAATLRAVEAATAAATAAGIRSAQAAAAAGGGFGTPGPGGGAPAANAALARRLHPEVDWPSWNYVAMRESGWNQFATNASSGAYGIPQALPGSKMGPAANPPQSNPTAQINWMVGYMNSRYGGSPGAAAHERAFNWYADGGVVGDTKPRKHVDPQQQRWLNQLARDVKVLRADEKHARTRRKLLNRSLAIDELWFLTHPNVEKGGIGWNEHEKSLMNDRRRLRNFNRTENAKETTLSKKIQLLRLLTHFPKGKMYGGPGVPSPPGDGGAGGGDGGGDGGGGTTTPSPPPAPPPIPPPPMPSWMVDAGLGGGASSGGFTFPAPVGAPQSFGGGMGWPEPVTPQSWGGGRSMGWGGGGDVGDLIAEIRALHQGVVGAVGRVAPGMSRGVDQSLNSMAARVSGRFS
jgi:hypothetical protein